MIRFFAAFLIILALFAGGCRLVKDFHDFHGAADPNSGGIFQPEFSAVRGSVAGITIRADFNQKHIAGNSYGNWSVKAFWENPRIDDSVATVTKVIIDEKGMGTAFIPDTFLKEIMLLCSEKPEAFYDEPGLTLQFMPDKDTWQFYNFQ